MTASKIVAAAASSAGGGTTDVDDVFSVDVRSGTGHGTAWSVNNGIDLSGEGGLVFYKSRTQVQNGIAFDTERGKPSGYSGLALLYPNATNSNQNWSWITQFNNNGFSGDGQGNKNDSNHDYVSWTFRKAPKFFDVVTYTGTGSAQSIAHNLGSVPGMIITKRTSSNSGWGVYHRSKGATAIGTLNATSGWITDTSFYNDTEPTSTHFTVGPAAYTGQNTETYVAYLFAHNNSDGTFGPDSDQDIIKCGSYAGNGTDARTINLGFEAQWLLVKRSDGATDWWIVDSMRGLHTRQESGKYLEANTSNAEASQGKFFADSQGFMVDAGDYNSSGENYIYMAIRRGPLAAPEDATKVFVPAVTGTNNDPSFPTPFNAPDFALAKALNGGSWYSSTRLLGNNSLDTSTTSTQANNSAYSIKFNGAMDSYWSGYTAWIWKRAPSYFDVIAYTGTGSAGLTVNHNLGVAPEMMWCKNRDGSGSSWVVYHKDLDGTNAATKYLYLNTTDAVQPYTGHFNDTQPTSSVITLGTGSGAINYSGRKHIIYLFASADGVSKVGSYTGNGSANHQIDCGFSSGARFVLIKRTDTSGEGWKVHDSVRGIVAGNDPFVELNNTNAENSSFDLLDPYSGGFAVNNYAGWNASGGSYIFYAIA